MLIKLHTCTFASAYNLVTRLAIEGFSIRFFLSYYPSFPKIFYEAWHCLNTVCYSCSLANRYPSAPRFLHHLFTTHVLRPSLLPPLLLTLRTSIFPANTLAPTRPIPSPAHQAVIKRACALEIISCIPSRVGRRFLLGSSHPRHREKKPAIKDQISERELPVADDVEGTDGEDREAMVKEVEAILDIFGDSYCNKHLVYGILELVLVRLVPEIGEKGVKELMAERLGEGWDD